MSNIPNNPTTNASAAGNSLGYDLSCIEDLTDEMAEVGEAMCWLQALARRVDTPRGALLDDPTYGYDVKDWIDAETDPSDFGEIRGKVDQEFLKDERTQTSSTDVESTPVAEDAYALTITSAVTSSAGPFTLVLQVTSVTVTILSVTPST